MPVIGQNRTPAPVWTRGTINQGATNGPGGVLNGQQVQHAATAQVPNAPAMQQGPTGNVTAMLHHADGDAWTSATPRAAKTLADGIWNPSQQTAQGSWKEVDPKTLNKSDRFATSFAFATALVESYEGKSTGTFQREDNLLSGIAKTLGGEAVPKLATDAARQFTQGNYAVDKPSYGLSTVSDKPVKSDAAFGLDKLSDRKFKEATTKMTTESVRVLDKVMCETFGTPGDPGSASRAAAKFPKDLCTHYAITCRAIDGGNHSDVDKAAMKRNAARDIFVLRTIVPRMNSPEVGSIVGAEGNQKISITKMSKAVQSLCNGQGLSQNNAHPEAERIAGPNFTARWSGGFDAFCQAALANADPRDVADAVRRGQEVLANRP